MNAQLETVHVAAADGRTCEQCQAPIAGDQISPAQPRGRRASSPWAAFGSNQFARSQPDFSPKDAPSSCRRAYVGAVRNGRPARRSWPGYLMS